MLPATHFRSQARKLTLVFEHKLVDLVADFVCRLLNHMKQTGAKKVTPELRAEDHNMPILPWIDQENFNPGYMMRGMHLLPKRGEKVEWQHTQDYWGEKDRFPAIDLDDAAFHYEGKTAAAKKKASAA